MKNNLIISDQNESLTEQDINIFESKIDAQHAFFENKSVGNQLF
jgi:hypothetical protein